MAEVLMVGSVALDSVETPYGKVDRALGGAATFASVAASFWTPVQAVGVVGDDFDPAHLAFLAQRGVDTEGIEVIAGGETFWWGGVYSADMNSRETLFTKLNVFEEFHPVLPAAYRQTPYLFLANIHPALQLDVLDQATGATFVGLDTMNLWIDITRDTLLQVIARTSAVFLNDEEARQLTGEANPVAAGLALLGLGPRLAVVKKGEHGALLFTAEGIFSAPGYPLERVFDPTGCGDCFAGGFMGYMAATEDLSEANLRRAVIYGSVVASYNAEDFSLDRLRTLTSDEIEARFEGFRRLTQF
ncbi:MAG TPA: sugar kinase [Armatimonadetes bacterium]|nr:sugar kinase [Armatimonadota bacterium]